MSALLKAEELWVDLDGETVPVLLRRNVRARKIILRVDAVTGAVKLTAPPHVRLPELRRFLNENRIWIVNERNKVQAVPVLGDGETLPFRGATYQIRYTGCPPRQVAILDQVMEVGGPADQAPKRLERWLREQARRCLIDDATASAAGLGVSFNRVSIGDMKTRWGSCSSRGTLRFNWRLILAPEAVRRYVAAHEVAHLLEMNHSPRFWRHVERLMPDYSGHRTWLRKNGNDLMRIRFNPLQTTG